MNVFQNAMSFPVWSGVCGAYAEGKLWYKWLLMCPPEQWVLGEKRQRSSRGDWGRKPMEGIPTMWKLLAYEPVPTQWSWETMVWWLEWGQTSSRPMKTEEKVVDSEWIDWQKEQKWNVLLIRRGVVWVYRSHKWANKIPLPSGRGWGSMKVTYSLLVVKSKWLNVQYRRFPQGWKPWDVSLYRGRAFPSGFPHFCPHVSAGPH